MEQPSEDTLQVPLIPFPETEQIRPTATYYQLFRFVHHRSGPIVIPISFNIGFSTISWITPVTCFLGRRRWRGGYAANPMLLNHSSRFVKSIRWLKTSSHFLQSFSLSSVSCFPLQTDYNYPETWQFTTFFQKHSLELSGVGKKLLAVLRLI